MLAGCLLVWLSLLFTGPGPENPTLALGRDLPFLSYEDAGGELSLAQLVALPASAMTSNDRPLSKGYTRSVFWLRATIPAAAFADGELWLKLSPNYVDHVAVHWRASAPDAPWNRRDLGERDGAATRDVDYRFAVLRLAPPPAGQDLELAMRVRTTSALIAEPTLWTPAAFTSHAAHDTTFWSFYLGLGALSSALALLLAIGLRTRLLWSVMPFSLAFLLVACIQGFVGWSPHAWRMELQHYLTGTLTLLGHPALAWMCIEALDLRRHFPRAYRALLASLVVGIVLPVSIPLDLYGEAVRIMVVVGLANALLLAGVAMRLWRRNVLEPLNLAFGILPLFYIASGLLAILITTATIRYDAQAYTLWQHSMMAIMMSTMLLVMALGVHRIRQERRTQREREQLARDLAQERETSFHQRQFLAMVSHEFRTPLAVIAGTLDNLRTVTPDVASIRQRHDKIQRAVQSLVRLTEDCLADARLSAGSLRLEPQPTDLVKLVREAASQLEVAAQHRFVLSVNVPGTGLPFIGDPTLLRIAISNVLNNAAKYARGGDIRVDVRAREAYWIVGIEDRGPGIPAAQAGQVFERYRQGRRTGDPDRGGYGLGLFVAREIARVHGGDLRLAANTPGGCRFEFQFPSAPTPPHAP